MKNRVIRGVVSVILTLSLLVPAIAIPSGIAQAASPTLSSGDRVAVTYDGGSVAVRSCASTACDPPITRMTAGYEGEIIDVPQSNQGYRWWHIRWVTGHTGWTADASLGGTPYLQALPGKGIYPSVSHNGLSYRVNVYRDVGSVRLAVRSAPGTGSSEIGRKSAGSRGWTLADNPVVTQEMVWWHIEWDDGVVGWSADSQAPYGVYLVKEGSRSLPTCSVSRPSVPSGTTRGIVNTSYEYSTGGSSCAAGHSVQYFFDWGDGTNSGWLPVGTTSAKKRWSVASEDGWAVKARARCATHTSVVSSWSRPIVVSISPDTPLSFTSLTHSAITTSTAPHDATLSAAGSNFNNVNRVTFAWSGAGVSGSAMWNRGDSNWNTKVRVHSDTSMTLEPRVVETSPTWSGTVTWTVTLRDTTGATASRTFTVTYTADERYSLTVATNPSGTGSIARNPNPGADGKYADNTVVTLTANPNFGYIFDGWSGTNNNAINPTTVTMDSDKTVVAWFTTAVDQPAKPYNLSPADGATGVLRRPHLLSSPPLEGVDKDSIPWEEMNGFWITRVDSQLQIRSAHTDYTTPVWESSSEGGLIDRRLFPSLPDAWSHWLASDVLDYETKYYWRVRFRDFRGVWSPWSDETSFTTRAYRPPEARFMYSPGSPQAGDRVELDASRSTPGEARILYYWWDLTGDGKFDGYTTSPRIYYCWDRGGTYEVTLEIENSYGDRHKITKHIAVKDNSWWERRVVAGWRRVFGSDGPSQEDLNIFDEIKRELRLLEDERFYPPGTDERIRDWQIMVALKDDMVSYYGSMTYEQHILQRVHDLQLVELYLYYWPARPEISQFWTSYMSLVGVWAEGVSDVELFGQALDGVIKAAGGVGIGLSCVLMIPKVVQAGIGLKGLYDTLYDRDRFLFFQDIYDESWLRLKEEEKEMLRSLRDEYAAGLTGPGAAAFKEEFREELRNLLYYAFEGYALWPVHIYQIDSPVELRVYDSEGNMVGMVQGDACEEIEGSVYVDGIVLIYPAADSYYFVLTGTEDGYYGGTITNFRGDEVLEFGASNMPTSVGAIDRYTVDWDALAQGEPGITIEKDYGGDGEVDETIETGMPGTPTNPSPMDNATEVSLDATLSWTGDDSESVTYNIYFGTTMDSPLVSERQAETTYTLTLDFGTTYYWIVVAINEHGISSAGPLWSFTTRGYRLTTSSMDGGSVTSPGEGTFGYDIGDTVSLAAEPDEGYQFARWTGDVDTVADVNAAETTITMDDHYSVTANFVPEGVDPFSAYQYTVDFGNTYPGIAEDFVPPFKVCQTYSFALTLTNVPPPSIIGYDEAELWVQLKDSPAQTAEAEITIEGPTGPVSASLSREAPGFSDHLAFDYIATLEADATHTYYITLHLKNAGLYELCFVAYYPGDDGTTPAVDPKVVAEKCIGIKAYQWMEVSAIDLCAKWNLISLPIIPFDTSADSILAPLPDKDLLAAVWHYDRTIDDWQSYAPGAPSDLHTIEDGKAYWIRIWYGAGLPPGGSFGTLWVFGTQRPLPPDAPSAYPVYDGWNMVGFTSTVSMPLGEYLWSFYDEEEQPLFGLAYGWDASGQMWFTRSEDGNLEPGHGYWIPFSLDGTTYPGTIPQLRHQFYGTVTHGGEPVSEGIPVEVFVGSVKQAETAVDSEGRYGEAPLLRLPGDVGGGEVTFRVGGVPANESSALQSGKIEALDLTIDELPYSLTISSTLGGSVTVPGEGACYYAPGDVVNLVAAPAGGHQFMFWSGDVSTIADVNAASTTITMKGDKEVTANFVAFIAPDNAIVTEADPGVESIAVSTIDPGEVDTSEMPEGIEAQEAYVVESEGEGSFTLRFTDVVNAESIVVYMVVGTDWIELPVTVIDATTIEVTMEAGGTPIVFCTPTAALPIPPVGGTAYPVNRIALLAPWLALAALITGAAVFARRRQTQN